MWRALRILAKEFIDREQKIRAISTRTKDANAKKLTLKQKNKHTSNAPAATSLFHVLEDGQRSEGEAANEPPQCVALST